MNTLLTVPALTLTTTWVAFEPQCSYTPHDPHHPSSPTVWVSNSTDLAYCQGAEQMSTHGPRILVLLTLTYKLSLLL